MNKYVRTVGRNFKPAWERSNTKSWNCSTKNLYCISHTSVIGRLKWKTKWLVDTRADSFIRKPKTHSPPVPPAVHMMSIQAIMWATFPLAVMCLITAWSHSNLVMFSIQLAKAEAAGLEQRVGRFSADKKKKIFQMLLNVISMALCNW